MAIRKCLQASLQNHLFEAPILQCLLQANSFNSNQPSSSHHMSQYIHLGLLTKPFSSSHQYRFASSDVARKLQAPEKVVLYRAKWMQPLRLMVRLKIFQLGGLAAFALPLAEYANEGSLSVGTIAAVTAVVGGAGAASAALWYYSRRYVGEMALVGPESNIVQLSVVDFWGNREDNKYDPRDVVPPLKGLSRSELEKAANQVLIPLDVIGARQFFFSIRHGQVINKELLFAILHGTLDFNDVQNVLARQQASLLDTPAASTESSELHQKI